ncbi:MAG TPA: hypothetical protein PKY63_12440 [Bacteroidales bacterium]|nr:hypothetical protein [Bacteroidales bacterium]
MINRLFVSLFLTALICCGVSEVIVAQKNNTETLHWWIEGGINNSFKEAYYPATDFSQPLSNANCYVGLPFSIETRSLTSGQISGGFSFPVNKFVNLNAGIEMVSIRDEIITDRDSVRHNMDSLFSFFIEKNNTIYFPLSLGASAEFRRMNIEARFAFPLLNINHKNGFDKSSERSISNSTAVWNMHFPAIIIRGKLGYHLSEKVELFCMYSRNFSKEIAYDNHYSLGIQYSFIQNK